MKRKKNKNSFPARYLLLVLCGICLIVMFLAYSVGGTSGGPLNSVASYIFVPMQKGINSVGTFFSNKSDRFQTLESVMDENTKLKEQVEKLSTELNTVKLEQYELEDLWNCINWIKNIQIIKKLRQMSSEKTAVTGLTSFDRQGKKDGIEKDMNVMAGNGLVGIVIDVGPHYAKVRSIIDDTSKVSGMVLSTSGNCIVNGDLQAMNDNCEITFKNLKDADDKVKKGDQVVTSYVSDKFLQGIPDRLCK